MFKYLNETQSSHFQKCEIYERAKSMSPNKLICFKNLWNKLSNFIVNP